MTIEHKWWGDEVAHTPRPAFPTEHFKQRIAALVREIEEGRWRGASSLVCKVRDALLHASAGLDSIAVNEAQDEEARAAGEEYAAKHFKKSP